MSEEDKMFFEKFILNNPFDFKQGIINHCRTMDKLDVYEWVAEDELKINNLTKENQELKKQLEETQANYEKEQYIVDKQTRQLTDEYKNTERQANKVKELENQQKEFIDWLENEIKRYRNTLSERPTNDLEYNNYKVTEVALEQIKIVSSKYKEIIGSDK